MSRKFLDPVKKKNSAKDLHPMEQKPCRRCFKALTVNRYCDECEKCIHRKGEER